MTLNEIELEEKFDLKLFDRKQNRIYLTEAGQKAFYYADKIFNLNNEMQHELKILSDEQNTSINLGGSTTVAQYLLPLLLKGFLKEYPLLKINITEANTEEIVIKVDEAEVDLGIVEAPVKHPDLLSEIFRADELFLIVNSILINSFLYCLIICNIWSKYLDTIQSLINLVETENII